ncbi:MAG: hypothetical protein ACSHWS_02785 [Sulfitobacter sp.]
MIILALVGVAGVVIAIYEHRQKRILLAHDLKKDARANANVRDHAMNLTIHPNHGPHVF